ncbi:MAG: GNAT family N-acetyltransferase [Deltaproteobacteria bacterium]|nr:GNAT family N-acetyltransferase [Deltaproteobacteria bacterium]
MQRFRVQVDGTFAERPSGDHHEDVPSYSLRVIDRIDQVQAAQWDSLLDPVATPFVRHAFLSAVEESGCASPERGWTPRHLLLSRGKELVAACAAYIKEDSDGDFSRDWDWANAAARARMRWYPKLSVTVPFTPVCGRRLLVKAGEDARELRAALVQGLREVARREKINTVHVLFPLEDEAEDLAAAGLATRVSYQFHWQNRGYTSMEDFLSKLNSKKRAMLKREMAQPEKQGIHLRTVRGDELATDWKKWAKTVAALHAHTVDKLMWGRRWLDQGFYERLFQAMPEPIEVVVAERKGKVIAGAFNVVGGKRLYGRYWGCFEEHPFLHFNVCLYHSVAECIALGREAFEGGAGGEHKLPRGFEPSVTWSAHAALDPRLDAAVRDTLSEETPARRAEIVRYREQASVFKKETAAGEPGVP